MTWSVSYDAKTGQLQREGPEHQPNEPGVVVMAIVPDPVLYDPMTGDRALWWNEDLRNPGYIPAVNEPVQRKPAPWNGKFDRRSADRRVGAGKLP